MTSTTDVKAALDTNVLVYAAGANDEARHLKALALLNACPRDRLVLPVQVCGELYNVLSRHQLFGPATALGIVESWRDLLPVVDTTSEVMKTALDLASSHRLSIWDAVVLAAAAEAKCDLLLTEDLQAGFRWRGVTVVHPFADPVSPLLDAFLDQARA